MKKIVSCLFTLKEKERILFYSFDDMSLLNEDKKCSLNQYNV